MLQSLVSHNADTLSDKTTVVRHLASELCILQLFCILLYSLYFVARLFIYAIKELFFTRVQCKGEVAFNLILYVYNVYIVCVNNDNNMHPFGLFHKSSLLYSLSLRESKFNAFGGNKGCRIDATVSRITYLDTV